MECWPRISRTMFATSCLPWRSCQTWARFLCWRDMEAGRRAKQRGDARNTTAPGRNDVAFTVGMGDLGMMHSGRPRAWMPRTVRSRCCLEACNPPKAQCGHSGLRVLAGASRASERRHGCAVWQLGRRSAFGRGGGRGGGARDEGGCNQGGGKRDQGTGTDTDKHGAWDMGHGAWGMGHGRRGVEAAGSGRPAPVIIVMARPHHDSEKDIAPSTHRWPVPRHVTCLFCYPTRARSLAPSAVGEDVRCQGFCACRYCLLAGWSAPFPVNC